MSRPTREAVFAALFAQLTSMPGLSTSGRKLRPAAEMQPEEFPAAYQLQGKQTNKYKGDVPVVGDWDACWALYSFSNDPAVAPSTGLNNMIDAALNLLQPPAGQKCYTLNGLVEYCAAEGTIEVFEGPTGLWAVALIPIRILVPGF